MLPDELKRKLRELKEFEKRIRFTSSSNIQNEDFIWHHFFSCKIPPEKNIRFPINYLLRIDHKTRREIFEEFFLQVYLTQFRQSNSFAFDSQLLAELGLLPSAGMEEIKKRFRELSKKYHPDLGGDNHKMAKLIDTYNKLVKNSQ